MRSNMLRTVISLCLLTLAVPALAGGPLIIFDAPSQTAWAYAPGVDYWTDRGPLGPLGNSRADDLAVAGAAQWSGVATATFSGAVAGDVGAVGLANITAANATGVIGFDNATDGIYVIYDDDGLIHSTILGAPPGVLGVATPEFGITATGILTESWMVLNGTTVDPADAPLGLTFGGVFTHEGGHAINLAHSQCNGAIIFFGDQTGPGSCATPYAGSPVAADIETMYPFIDVNFNSIGKEQATVEHLDDTGALSDVYGGAAGYPGNFGRIEGMIFNTNAVSQLSGVNVIARNVADPFSDAQSSLSGDFTQGAGDGRYHFNGLTPGADYVVYVDEIVAGGFSTTPVSPLPGPEEFHNVAESNSPVTDPQCDVTAISVSAGSVDSGIDVIFNLASPPATIDVAPVSLNFSVPVNGSDSDNLTITNTAGAGALDLVWTIVDEQLKTSTSRPVMVRQPDGSLIPRENMVYDGPLNQPGDPLALRQCRDCGAKHPLGERTPGLLNKDGTYFTDNGFEGGSPSAAWTEASTNFGTPLCTVGGCGTGGGTGPNSGAWWAWFGGIATVEIGSVSQVVNFPSSATLNLEFFLEVPACDSGADFMEVLIDGNQVFIVDGTDGACGAVGYVEQVVDVSAFADGAAHTVEFRSEIFAVNASGSNFFVDDICLKIPPPPCLWLDSMPAGGLTGGGLSDNVTVSVDATGLPVGVYNCELQVESNAANAPLVIVPVQLTVTGGSPEINANVTTAAGTQVSLRARPDGGGSLFTNAQDNTGAIVDATVTVVLTDELGDPVVGFPAGDLSLVSQSGGWLECPSGGLAADGPTDGTGTTTFSGPLPAGGFSGPGELMQLVINHPDANTITYGGGGAGLDILVNSGDLNKSFGVGLADVGPFAVAYSTYGYEADLWYDLAMDLNDVAQMAVQVGTACAPTPSEDVQVTEGVLGIYFDPAGRRTAIDLPVGEVVEAHVLLQGAAARNGISAWDGRVRTSQNVQIVSQTFSHRVVDFSQGDDLMVGLSEVARTDDDFLSLMTLRLRVTDPSPAHLWLEGHGENAMPNVVSGGTLRAAAPSSGSKTSPVAYLNDAKAPVIGGGFVFEGVQLGNYPNPFNPSTEFHFNLPRAGQAAVRIYDVAGRLVNTLEAGTLAAGPQSLTWQGNDHRGSQVGSGNYFYRLSLDGVQMGDTRKMTLVK